MLEMISDSLDVTGRTGEGLRQNINTWSMSCGQNEHIQELDAKRAQVKEVLTRWVPKSIPTAAETAIA